MYEECFCRTKVVGYGLSEAFVTVGKIMARLRWPRTPQNSGGKLLIFYDICGKLFISTQDILYFKQNSPIAFGGFEI